MREIRDEEETRLWGWGNKMMGKGLVVIYREPLPRIALGFLTE